jgi:hypothetical protein
MSYLAQGLLGGFQQGYAAGNQAKTAAKLKAERDAERQLRKERQVIEDTRYYAAETDQQERQLAEDARRRMDREDALKRDARNFAYQKDRDATGDLRATMADARQTRMDWSTEQKDQRDEETRRIQNERLLADIELVKKQADAFGSPTERLEYDPNDPTGAPKRIVTRRGGSADTAEADAGSAEDFSAYEGQKLKGPDGKLYLIKNGRPVPAR